MPLTLETKIAAPPAFVRDLFLDFPNLPKWHISAWIKYIKPSEAGVITGANLKDGDKIKSEIGGITFNQTILENSTTTLRWTGPFYGLLTGTHSFTFAPDPSSPDHTLFTQSESFTGLLGFLMDSPTSMGGKKTLESFKGLNQELKEYAEKEWAAKNSA